MNKYKIIMQSGSIAIIEMEKHVIEEVELMEDGELFAKGIRIDISKIESIEAVND